MYTLRLRATLVPVTYFAPRVHIKSVVINCFIDAAVSYFLCRVVFAKSVHTRHGIASITLACDILLDCRASLQPILPVRGPFC